MTRVVIENPVLNSPYQEPRRHFRFTDDGITSEIVEERRVSSYFVPIPKPRRRGGQLSFDTEWTGDRLRENTFINRVRGRVALWRQGGYLGVTGTTKELLRYWKREDRARRLFFCQLEAVETIIYVTEVASRYGDAWIEAELRQANLEANPLLYRTALKMATGSGKTAVMAMLIAWHVLNKLENPQDVRFGDAFLVVTPGITIRDRLRVLLPSDPASYYQQRQMDLVPRERLDDLGRAKIVITNFHSFMRRETLSAGKLTKAILSRGDGDAFTETPGQMVRRVCRELGNSRNVVVINDEAHHCYRRKTEEDGERLRGDERREASKREEEARIWVSGLEAVKAKMGIRAVYDLSATPFFLRGSGYSEGTLFPWVVSDFALIDAIECGIVKVPRVPVDDNAMTGEQPTYRDLWQRVRDELPRRGRKGRDSSEEPVLPAELEGALHSLYGNYEKYYRLWEEAVSLGGDGGEPATPPVFIIVCSNTAVSKLVFDYVAGWEKKLSDGSIVAVPGQLPLFSNVVDGRFLRRPYTILVDSRQLESGEAMSADFKKAAAQEIAEFKEEYRIRFPGADVEKLTDEDLLREVMNTVGKPGKLGEQVRCVVSVSMLTEGWDANTVTHILGVRAFGTQLLCEQVVGRGLRRMSFALSRDGMLEPEYAEVYGVPFSFIPTAGSQKVPTLKNPTRVRALAVRVEAEITFPRVMGYRYEVPPERLEARFSEESRLALSTWEVPTSTENAPIVGESSIHTLDDLREHRLQEVSFLLAKLVLQKYFRGDGEETEHVWRFPEVLRITRRWLQECVVCKDGAFPQLLLLRELAHDAADRVYRSIVAGPAGRRRVLPILQPYEMVGATHQVDFDTTRDTYATDARKCHVNYVVADSGWESKMAQTLEAMDEVLCYVKNNGLSFYIPYTLAGEQRNYMPDFIVHLDDGHGREDPLRLVIEVSGEARKDKAAKVATARTLWVPAVNNHGAFGRWAFIEVTDPWDAENSIRGMMTERPIWGKGEAAG